MKENKSFKNSSSEMTSGVSFLDFPTGNQKIYLTNKAIESRDTANDCRLNDETAIQP
jgi:hypothetical protein